MLRVPRLALLLLLVLVPPATAQTLSLQIPDLPGLAGARDVAVDASGNIYVSAMGDCQIVKLSPTGVELLRVALPYAGGGGGRPSPPNALDVDDSGNIYVQDWDDGSLRKLDAAGRIVMTVPMEWTGGGSGLALDHSGHVYVAGYGEWAGEPCLRKFSASTGALLGTVRVRSGIVEGIAVDAQDNVYAALANAIEDVVKFDPTGQVVWSIGRDDLGMQGFSGWGVDVNAAGDVFVAGQRYTTNQWIPEVIRLDSGGHYVESFGSKGTQEGQFWDASGLAIDGAGMVYVADQTIGRIQKFSGAGTVIASYGAGGGAVGRLTHPEGVSVDRAGNIYVSDTYNQRIQKFGPQGEPLLTFGVQTYPRDLVVDGRGTIYLIDDWQVAKFDATGTRLGVLSGYGGRVAVDELDQLYVAGYDDVRRYDVEGNQQFSFPLAPSRLDRDPSGLAVDGAGNVFVAGISWGFGIVDKYDPFGTLLGRVVDGRAGPLGFLDDIRIAVDGPGNLYVCDQYSGPTSVLDPHGKLLYQFGAHGGGGTGEYCQWGVEDVAVGAPGTIYILDMRNNRVQRYVAAVCANGAVPIGLDTDGDGLDDACDPCPADPANTCEPDRSTSATVMPSGGTVSTPDNSVRMTFPPGAVSSPTPISITDSGRGTLFQLSTGSGNGTALFAVTIEPAGFVFNVPITIRMKWTDADHDGRVDGTNISEDNLIVFKDGAAISGRCRNETLCNRTGDFFDVQVNSLSEFALVDLRVPMDFVLRPGTLNLRSMGRWVDGCLEPPEGFEASAIDVSSIRLNGVVPADSAGPATIGDHDGDGRPDLCVKFDRSEVELNVTLGDSVPVTVTGEVSGQPFQGTAVIRVRRAPVTEPAAGTVVTTGDVMPVRWQTPSGVAARSVALLSTIDDGAIWRLEATGIPNSGGFDWTVTTGPTDLAKVAIVLVEAADSTGYLVEGVLGVSERFVVHPPAGVDDQRPGVLALHGVSPTPARGSIQVAFSLAAQGGASLALFDVSGRLVESRDVGSLGAGPHRVTLGSGGSLPAGVYVVRLSQGGAVRTARAVVVR
jgi:sugar lactone lactonase YvrE